MPTGLFVEIVFKLVSVLVLKVQDEQDMLALVLIPPVVLVKLSLCSVPGETKSWKFPSARDSSAGFES